jgi:hypothetical protein
MPISDLYTGSIPAAGTAIASVSTLPIAALVTGASKRAWVVGVRIGITATSASSGDVLFQLARATNAASISGTTTNNTTSQDPHAPAALATFSYSSAGGTWSTAPTGNVSILWQQTLPNTVGSSWEEFPPLGYEHIVDVSAGVALWVTSGSASSTTYSAELVWSE